MKLRDDARQDLDLLSRLMVPGTHGPRMLGAMADLKVDSGPAEIDRYDRLRNVNFNIELNGQPLGEVEKQALAMPSLRNLPPGVIQTTIGDAEAMGELFESFGLAMATGVLCIYVGAGFAVPRFRSARHDPCCAGTVCAGGISCLVCDAYFGFHARHDRLDHADGHRHQKLYLAGGIRDHGTPR